MLISIDTEIRKMMPAHQREFCEVKAACYGCPFMYMRKDSLAVFLKCTIRPNFQLTIGTNRAFELLGRTETYTHLTTAFVYFTWKRRHLKQHPPSVVRTRLKYLVMPAKIAPNMLLKLYEHTYGTDNETEVLRVATSLFGEPQAGKYAIPPAIYNNRMTWPQYCPLPPGSPPPFPPDAPNGEFQVPPGMHSRTPSSGTSDTRKRRSTNDGYIAFDDDESSDEGDASDSSDRNDAGARFVMQAMADLALDTAEGLAERAEAVERVDVVERVEAVERVEPATADQPPSSIPDREQPAHPPRPQYRAVRDLAQPARRVGPPASPTSSSAVDSTAPPTTRLLAHLNSAGRVALRDDRYMGATSGRGYGPLAWPRALPTTASMSIRVLFTLLRDRARAKAGAPSRARTAAKDLTRDLATMPQGRQLTASDFFASFDDDDEDMDEWSRSSVGWSPC
ncbi:hypothetical protein AMAG_14351 [Allomyces macrogynus ATCC 38327]|uniref:Uncharacterized protein n=1 Tax=Allomyces macrogynus (strain ATCC 38327) TaxID=578462 RepID=A0A0L0T4S6_ALLM3|nr:hypothetical protein AMAG_14351 [Allomyces macrogynus ATCC 38327]|eukprot:KNE69813.1 hypothetical protein AMAG_14351 [Allomyces macrogynus ATCC 38327]